MMGMLHKGDRVCPPLTIVATRLGAVGSYQQGRTVHPFTGALFWAGSGKERPDGQFNLVEIAVIDRCIAFRSRRSAPFTAMSQADPCDSRLHGL